MEYLDDYKPEEESIKHEHKHTIGTMDIAEQEKTYHGFLLWSKRITYVIIGILVFLALTSS